LAICPPLTVAAPPVDKAVRGLFAAARFPELPSDGNGNRWECGIQYEALTCANPEGWQGACPPEVPDDKAATLTLPLVQGDPFTVLLGINCKLTGYTLEQFRSIVTNAFVACEQRRVEEIFWTGSMGNNPHLADPSTVIVPPGATVDAPLSITAGVAALESYLGSNYCGDGILHAPRGLGAFAARSMLIQGPQNRLTTPLGTRWAFGDGYAVNTGPDGVEAPPGVAWIYATGGVNIWRSEVYINPDELVYAFNRATNEVEMFAERNYVITYECASAAVPVSISCDC
jgi:hypothetical protein